MSTLSVQSSSKPSESKIITYRLSHGKMVYVTPPADYEAALDYAREVFPTELRDVPRERISFHITVLVGSKHKTVQIAPMAWSSVISSLTQFEIVDLVIQPLPSLTASRPRSTEIIRRTYSDPAAARRPRSQVASLRNGRPSRPASAAQGKSRAPSPELSSSHPFRFVSRLVEKIM